jgi:hypothetical protein
VYLYISHDTLNETATIFLRNVNRLILVMERRSVFFAVGTGDLRLQRVNIRIVFFLLGIEDSCE